jgi:hypothetical protein
MKSSAEVSYNTENILKDEMLSLLEKISIPENIMKSNMIAHLPTINRNYVLLER